MFVHNETYTYFESTFLCSCQKLFHFYWICKISFLVYFTIVLPYVENVDSCHKGSSEQKLATYKNPHVTLNAISSFFLLLINLFLNHTQKGFLIICNQGFSCLKIM